MREYLITISRRFARWLIAAAVALALYGAARALDLPDEAALVAMLAGAVAGSVLAMYVIQRLFGPEPEWEPAPPRGRGGGKRGASQRRS